MDRVSSLFRNAASQRLKGDTSPQHPAKRALQTVQGERLTGEEMQRLIERADLDKLRKAREWLLRAEESEGQRKEKS
jgi:hypothetical protein